MTATAIKVPTIKSWAAHKIGGVPMSYTHHEPALGRLQIMPVFDHHDINIIGWKLMVSCALPYGATGQPYQLDQVTGALVAARLVPAAQRYAEDRKAQLAVKQACLA